MIPPDEAALTTVSVGPTDGLSAMFRPVAGGNTDNPVAPNR